MPILLLQIPIAKNGLLYRFSKRFMLAKKQGNGSAKLNTVIMNQGDFSPHAHLDLGRGYRWGVAPIRVKMGHF